MEGAGGERRPLSPEEEKRQRVTSNFKEDIAAKSGLRVKNKVFLDTCVRDNGNTIIEFFIKGNEYNIPPGSNYKTDYNRLLRYFKTSAKYMPLNTFRNFDNALSRLILEGFDALDGQNVKKNVTHDAKKTTTAVANQLNILKSEYDKLINCLKLKVSEAAETEHSRDMTRRDQLRQGLAEAAITDLEQRRSSVGVGGDTSRQELAMSADEYQTQAKNRARRSTSIGKIPEDRRAAHLAGIEEAYDEAARSAA